MTSVSLFVRVEDLDPRAFGHMCQSLLNQTIEDWEVIFLLPKEEEKAFNQFFDSKAFGKKAKIIRIRDQAYVAAMNHAMPDAKEWIGFMGVNDRLAPDALEKMTSVPEETKVTYSNSSCVSRWGAIWWENQKVPLNPIRLNYHDHLEDLTLARKEVITSLGGFDVTVSNHPMHRILIAWEFSNGPSGFQHIDEFLYFRHYLPLEEKSSDPREPEYVPPFDMQGVKISIDNRSVIEHVMGVPDIHLLTQSWPEVDILLFLPDDYLEGKDRILSIFRDREKIYPRFNLIPVYIGEDENIRHQYKLLCRHVDLTFWLDEQSRPEVINKRVMSSSAEFLLVLDGKPTGQRFLKELVNTAILHEAIAVAPKLIHGTRTIQPNTPEWKYEDKDWNHRGHYGELTVPHQVSVVSDRACLIKTKDFHLLDEYEHVYLADWSMRASKEGATLVWTPNMIIITEPEETPASLEIERMKKSWTNWKDPYGLNYFN